MVQRSWSSRPARRRRAARHCGSADDEGDLRPVAAQVDIAGTGAAPSRAEPSTTTCSQVVGRTGEPALLNSGTVSVLCVPLVRHDRLLGLIALGAGAADRFDDDDAALLGRFAIPAATRSPTRSATKPRCSSSTATPSDAA